MTYITKEKLEALAIASEIEAIARAERKAKAHYNDAKVLAEKARAAAKAMDAEGAKYFATLASIEAGYAKA